MPRPFEWGRRNFAPARSGRGIAVRSLGGLAARWIAAVRRSAFVSLALLGAALAGLLFAVLLPICGIASIAEGLARWCWDLARDPTPQAGRGIAPQR
jgi:hypothetical protein